MAERPTVYLAGPINGLTYGTATDWRVRAAIHLAPEIIAISPMRGKEFLRDVRSLGSGYAHPLAAEAGIVARDRFDVRRADLVLANFAEAKAASIGTCVEFGWADAYGKPIVVVLPADDSDNPHEHPFIRRLAGFRVNTLDDGLAVVRAILLS